MGSVVEMRFVRAILLAIVVAIALLGSGGSTAYADTGSQGAAPDSANSADGGAQVDPSDPLLPPD